MKVSLSNPDITSLEKRLVMQVLNSHSLSLGPKLTEFENKFSDYIGCKYAISVNSGTSGLHLSMKAIDLKEGDEVITSPFSFISSANCILYEKGVPVFVDIDSETCNIDVEKIEDEITPNTKAILVVHVFGRPCNMNRILQIARKHHLFIIEDACEAIGAEYLLDIPENGYNKPKNAFYKKAGTFGNCGVFAFYPNKQITTGEGGIIVTDDDKIANLCKSLRNQGRGENGRWLLHERLGYNYRISDLNCALGIAQLDRIREILDKRNRVANWYFERLSNVEQLVLPSEMKDGKISWFVYVVRLIDDFSQDDRDRIIDALISKGIGCNCYFPPIHLQPFYMEMFGYRKGDFPITEHISKRTIALPFFSNMSRDQVNYVCDKLIQILKNYKLKPIKINKYSNYFKEGENVLI